jgi:hypothetical protein
VISASADTGLLSPRSEAQHTLLTWIEEAIAFLKADPTTAEAISTAVIGGDQPYNTPEDDQAVSPGMFQTFA